MHNMKLVWGFIFACEIFARENPFKEIIATVYYTLTVKGQIGFLYVIESSMFV